MERPEPLFKGVKQTYQDKDRNGYDYRPSTVEARRAAWENEAACSSHPSRTMPEVALSSLGIEAQSAIKADSVARDTDLDAELQALSAEDQN